MSFLVYFDVQTARLLNPPSGRAWNGGGCDRLLNIQFNKYVNLQRQWLRLNFLTLN